MSNTWIMVIGIGGIFIATTLGASLVFFFRKDISPKINTVILGFASGVMISAAIWGLLLPALNQADGFGKFNWLPAAVGFIAGGLFLVVIDKIVPHMHKGTEEEEGLKSNFKKPTKLFLAVTIHNIPEGLAVGFAFGGAMLVGSTAAYISALGLAIGIAIQNIPEGAAISLPMKQETGNNFKSFLYGTASGIVEPIFAVLGVFLATQLTMLMPWLLSFAAGAMIFVVAEDLIPDAKLESHPHLATWGVMVGFVVMMILDIALS